VPRGCDGVHARRASRRQQARQQRYRGETIFAAIGCTRCHIPILFTGRDTNPVFDRRPVALYSDLLLHGVATGDGIPQAAALANEIRTPALWGLRFRRPFLHDGSAATPLEERAFPF
jgi:CxxC motif-containing protein (DUF1111 family)